MLNHYRLPVASHGTYAPLVERLAGEFVQTLAPGRPVVDAELGEYTDGQKMGRSWFTRASAICDRQLLDVQRN